MADLSPAAQAVLDACDRMIDREMSDLAFDPCREALTRDIAAAALRTAVTEIGEPGLGAANLKRKLLAIADELEDRQ